MRWVAAVAVAAACGNDHAKPDGPTTTPLDGSVDGRPIDARPDGRLVDAPPADLDAFGDALADNGVPVGAWQPAGGGWTGIPCLDGLRFAAAGDHAYACTMGDGFLAATVASGAITWTSIPGAANPLGTALATHPIVANQLTYVAQGQPDWFRSADAATSWTSMNVVDTLGAPRTFYAVRFQPMVGFMLGSWDPAGPAAIVLAGINSGVIPHQVADATGTARAFAGTGPTDLWVAVYARTPGNNLATGGIYHSANKAFDWTEMDNGLVADDRARVFSIVLDPIATTTLYVSLRGGGQIYKTGDAGATWARSNTGLAPEAEVLMIAISPVDHAHLYAATTAGLYASTDSGASWSLVGFGGREVRAIALHPTDATEVLVGVADVVGLYRGAP